MDLGGSFGRIVLYPHALWLPQYWARCEGQVASASENDVLFRLLGTSFGGDGRATFALPDLRGKAPLPDLTYQITVAGDWPTKDGGEYYLGMILLFPFTTVPEGWSTCEGQVLPIVSNTALYALLGSRFGGDDHSTFTLPDLRGKAPAGMQDDICLAGAFPHEDPDAGPDFPFPLGTIILVASTVLPAGWLPCEGQQLALTNPQDPRGILSIIDPGESDGSVTLPDLRDKAPLPGLRYCILTAGEVPKFWKWPPPNPA